MNRNVYAWTHDVESTRPESLKGDAYYKGDAEDVACWMALLAVIVLHVVAMSDIFAGEPIIQFVVMQCLTIFVLVAYSICFEFVFLRQLPNTFIMSVCKCLGTPITKEEIHHGS